MADSDFDALKTELAAHGPDGVLGRVVEQLRGEKKYHELFEALKMQIRRKLGLPIASAEGADGLSEAKRNELEEGLISACREVGTLLLKEGKVREGWMYLRPVGDKVEAAKLLAAIKPGEDNTEEIIEVTLHEGIDIARGFGLVLESYGTCSSITTYDSSVARRPRKEQEPAARLLLHRLHADLVGSVKVDIARQEGSQPKETTLKDLVADREWLFQENSYHIDTTHLASTTRIARNCSDEADLRLALDLTEYGRRLSAQFQYQGDEPFSETYPSHTLYFQALLGENVDEALAYFKNKAEMLDPQYHTMIPAETYVDLLARIGRYPDAVAAAIALSKPGVQPVGIAPSLLELAVKAGDYSAVLEYCKGRGDVLGYAAGLVAGAK
ncbi:MAG: hypothetical protein ACR2FY_25735 [Pirellulaceae bacterium]